MSIPRKYINYRTRLGIEFRLSNNVKLRGGLKQAHGAMSFDEKNAINFRYSFGIGTPIKIWRKQYLQLDYALDPGNVGEGLSHLFSFSMEFK